MTSGALAACGPRGGGSAKGEAPPSAFPSKEALAAVSKQPAPALGKTESYVEVAEWPLQGPFPETAQAREALVGEEPWTVELKKGVAARAGVTLATQAMQCTARQLAQFLIEHDKLPAPSLRAFMAARCGATVVGMSASWVTGTADPADPDAKLHNAWQAQLAPMYADLPAGNSDVGVWMARKGEKVVVLRATGQRRVLLNALAADPATPGLHVVRAELLHPAASVRVMVNRGRFGFAECTVVYTAPSVEARCPADPADDQAWISMASFPAGRVLGERVLDVLVWPKGTAVDTYARVPVGDATIVTTLDGLREGLFATVNELRKVAQLSALTDEPAQTVTAAQVAPYYFAAQERLVPETVADVVALGMRAGWQVAGLVRSGQFTAPATIGTNKVGDLVALAIEHPFGRETLLDPDVRRVSIGPVWSPETQFMGAVITTYALLDDPAPALAERVFERFKVVRAQGGRAAPERDDRLDGAVAEVRAQLLAGDVDADAALRRLMGAYSQGVSGFWIEMDDPETMEIPPAIAKAEKARIALVVARHRRPDQPWGRYVVFVLVDGLAASMNI